MQPFEPGKTNGKLTWVATKSGLLKIGFLWGGVTFEHYAILIQCWQNQLRSSGLWHDGHMCVSVCVWQWAGRPRLPPQCLRPPLRQGPPPVWWNKVALVTSIHPSIHLLMTHIQHGAWSMSRLQRSRVQHCGRRWLTLGMAITSLFLYSFISLSLFSSSLCFAGFMKPRSH